jgi:hypothetical protein
LDLHTSAKALGMVGAARSHLLGERLARKSQDGTLGQKTHEPEDQELDTMQVHVGPATTYQQPQPPPPQTGTAKGLAGILGTALAAGTAGFAGHSLLAPDAEGQSQRPQPVIVEPDAAERGYQIRLSQGDPESDKDNHGSE